MFNYTKIAMAITATALAAPVFAGPAQADNAAAVAATGVHMIASAAGHEKMVAQKVDGPDANVSMHMGGTREVKKIGTNGTRVGTLDAKIRIY